MFIFGHQPPNILDNSVSNAEELSERLNQSEIMDLTDSQQCVLGGNLSGSTFNLLKVYLSVFDGLRPFVLSFLDFIYDEYRVLECQRCRMHLIFYQCAKFNS